MYTEVLFYACCEYILVTFPLHHIDIYIYIVDDVRVCKRAVDSTDFISMALACIYASNCLVSFLMATPKNTRTVLTAF